MTDTAGAEGPTDVKTIVGRTALLVSATRFLPLPLVDDLLADRARRHMVEALQAAHGRPVDATGLDALWTEEAGCVRGCLLLPFKILLWPFKKLFKTVFFFFAAREVALEVAHTLLLGRALDRWLAAGTIPAGEAARYRAAFDAAFDAANNQVMVDGVRAALKQLGTLGSLGAREVKRLIAREDPTDLEELPEAQRDRAASAMATLASVMEEPRVVAFLADFDRRLDAGLS